MVSLNMQKKKKKKNYEEPIVKYRVCVCFSLRVLLECFNGVCYVILPDESYAIAFGIIDFLRNNGTKLA